MSIFNLQDIHCVMEHEQQLARHYDKVAYIKGCYNKVLNQRLFTYFEKDYLFHAVYYLDDKNNFHDIADFEIPDHIKNTQAIISRIHQGAERIKSGEQTDSFTKLMCRAQKQVLCLFKGDDSHSYSNSLLLYQDIASGMEEIVSGISDFFSEDHLFIEYLVGCYKEIAESVDSECYIYFIRPFTHFDHYNGVFSMITRRRLSEEETIELGAIWTKILSDTVMVEVEKEAKIHEQNAIFEEHTHTWNADLTSLYQHLNIISKRFVSESGRTDTAGIRPHIDYALEKAGVLRKIIHFNLFLMKVQEDKSRDKTEPDRQSSQNRILLKAHAPETVSIRHMVTEVLRTLKSVTGSYRLVDQYYEEKFRILEELEKEAEKFSDIQIQAIPVGVYIIILDLLKNALYHTDFDQPGYRVEIRLRVKNHTVFFHVINSGRLSDEAWDYINLGETFSESNFRRKGGIRTIKRILDCPLFTPFQPWSLHARCLSKENLTDIYLSIPLE